MEKLDLSSKLNFDKSDLTAPTTIIKEMAEQIERETYGIIKGVVDEYRGSIVSYKTSISFSGLQAALFGSESTENDIQKLLGKQGENLSKYEFYLNTPVLTQYRYRICFIQHGIANYPVDVVLEQSIADEVNKRGANSNSNYNYTCYNSKEFEELIIKVIYSKKVIRIMQELINIYQIHKQDDSVDDIDQSNNQDVPNNDDENIE